MGVKDAAPSCRILATKEHLEDRRSIFSPRWKSQIKPQIFWGRGLEAI